MSHSDKEMPDTKQPAGRNEDKAESDELKRLRQENAALKQLVRRAMHEKLKLADLPQYLQDNREVILEAVRSDAVSWYDLSPKWKNDVEVTCVAFELQRLQRDRNTGVAYCSSDRSKVVWKHLPYHLMTNEKVLAIALEAQGGPQWKEVPFQSRSNPKIISAAFQNYKIEFEDVPIPLRRHHRQIAFACVKKDLIVADECSCFDDAFLRQAIEKGELKWNQLPTNLRNDTNFAHSISSDTGRNILVDILRNLPALRHDHSFWHRLLGWSLSNPTRNSWKNDKLDYYRFQQLFEEFAPTEIRADRAFMFEMCCENADIFPFVHASLSSDNDFWQKLLAKNVAVLQFLSHETQLLYPDLVRNCIPALGKLGPNHPRSTPSSVAEAIEPSFWRQHAFAFEWVNTGLDVPFDLPHEVQRHLMSIRDIALAYVKHAGSLHHFTSQELKGDCDFMMEVVGYHPKLYTCRVGKARRDPCVLITALSGSAEFAKTFLLDRHLNGKDDMIDCIRMFLRLQLSAFDTFSRCILGNMLSTQSIEGTGSNLTMLNQGVETSLVFKKSLAAYVGIPTGNWLSLLRDAERNVLKAIVFWANPSL